MRNIYIYYMYGICIAFKTRAVYSKLTYCSNQLSLSFNVALKILHNIYKLTLHMLCLHVACINICLSV